LISFQSDEYTTTVQSQTIPLEVEVLVITTGEESLPTGAIAGRLVEKLVTQEKEFVTTGKKTSTGIATGTITIVNNYSSNQPLVATTRFLTTDGTLFRLKEGVTVPANGSVEAEINADEAGISGDIEPTKLTIPGLSSSLQEYIYGELKSPTSGGSGEVSYVLETDIANAKTELDNEAQTASFSDFEAELGDGEFLLPEFVATQKNEPTFSAEIGQEISSFTASVSENITALIILESDLSQKIIDQLAEEVPAGTNSDDYLISDKQYEVQEYNQESGYIKLMITAQAS